MTPNYIQVESTIKPLTIEFNVDTVYLRKNIVKEICTDDSDTNTIYWTYLEAKMTPEEFNSYAVILNARNIENIITGNNDLAEQSANIALDTEYLVCLAEI